MRFRQVLLTSGAVSGVLIVALLGYIYFADRNAETGSAESEYTHAELRAEYSRMQAVVDFDSVAGWAMECMGITSSENLPPQYKLLLSYYRVKPSEMSPSSSNDMKKPSNEQRAILILNRALSFGREYYRLQAEDAAMLFSFLTLSGIGVGMLATIFVSISSTEFGRGEGGTQKALRFLAIIFPIMGTAISGVIAFYSPQTKGDQAARTLERLTQLHAEMALNIWSLKCELQPDDLKMLKEWSSRYVDIQTVSAAAGSFTPTIGTGNAVVPSTGK